MFRDIRARVADRRHCVDRVTDDHGHWRRRRERRRAGEHLVGHAAECIEVAARVDGVAGPLFGAHVVRGAERHADHRQFVVAGGVDGVGDPEVGYDRVVVLEEDVLGLDVAVDDAAVVRVAERVGDLVGNAKDVGDRQRSVARQPVAEGLALDERHDVEDKPVDLARIEEREDIRVAEVGRGGDLAQEAFVAERGGEFGAEDLHRDLAVVLEVLGEVHGGHPTGTEFPFDAVPVSERGGEVQVHGGGVERPIRVVRVWRYARARAIVWG